jgi:hypothetical protein
MPALAPQSELNGPNPVALANERVGPLRYLRNAMRNRLFAFLRKLAGTDDARAILTNVLQNQMSRLPDLHESDLFTKAQPYTDLGVNEAASQASLRDDVIIITARFRSGSTLLWNLFRHLDGYTAYYEPFNERRWFDPKTRGRHTDTTHRGVEDYWREYEGLESLGEYYREAWIDHNLFMDAQSWDPGMKKYVEMLIDRASGRPVLQFNRIDFRLPWFRHHFPNAKLLHLYRHPRDQWCSSLVNPAAVPRELTVAEFTRHDHYYLRNWARDLKYHFPFLDESQVSHPYQLFYYIWKLSYLFGRRYAHYSLAFEDLTADPMRALSELFTAAAVREAPIAELAHLVDKPRSGRWREYAPEEWFQKHEADCERVLAEFLRGT